MMLKRFIAEMTLELFHLLVNGSHVVVDLALGSGTSRHHAADLTHGKVVIRLFIF
jgi:hypothetical protein